MPRLIPYVCTYAKDVIRHKCGYKYIPLMMIQLHFIDNNNPHDLKSRSPSSRKRKKTTPFLSRCTFPGTKEPSVCTLIWISVSLIGVYPLGSRSSMQIRMYWSPISQTDVAGWGIKVIFYSMLRSRERFYFQFCCVRRRLGRQVLSSSMKMRRRVFYGNSLGCVMKKQCG